MILILNGPNLNLLGTREPDVYGGATLSDLEKQCERWANEIGIRAECRQSNYEGQLIDWLHGAADEGAKGIIINPGGLTHTSVSLRDAVSGIATPVVEVHISNVHAREDFRRHSYLSAIATGVICGLGTLGYELAVEAVAAAA